MLVAGSPDVLANLRNRATAWPYVSAAVAAATLVAYLSVWGQPYGMDLKVYRDAVNSLESGQIRIC